MIRNGMNKKNFEYWRDEIFIRFHKKEPWQASMESNIVIQGQEIEMLKDRIIKLEKKCVKLQRNLKKK